MSDLFDFSRVEVPKVSEYLTPGIYTLSVSKVELETPTDKTPYLNITFEGEQGIMKQKFYLTPKAFPSLQYLHNGMFGKILNKTFENVQQIHAYFERALTTKKIDKVILVGGQESNGKVYTELPYCRFFVDSDSSYKEGPFEEGSSQYNKVVRKSSKSEVSSTDSTLLPNDINSSQLADNNDDLPW